VVIYVSFIYESCVRDAEKAFTIAQKSTAFTPCCAGRVYRLRGKLELFRFKILTERSLLARDEVLVGAHRKKLSSRAQQGEAIVAQMETLEATYIRNRPSTDMDELKAERAWFAQNCRERGDKYVEE
jgi:hypothetical protein